MLKTILQKKHILITTTLLISFLPIAKTFAYITVSPSQNTITTKENTTTKKRITFKNGENTSITITPKVFSYDPREEKISSNEKEIFVKIDEKEQTVKTGETVTLEYEIVPTETIPQGTHLNLIILQNNNQQNTEKNNQVGISANISHLVVLNKLGEDSFPKNFAYINMEIVDIGIPFIKPTKIKYTLHNTTDFVIIPAGEIQIFNQKGGYQPIYLQINNIAKKLYPNESMTETFEIKEWHIQDLLFSRNIVGFFYNGINDTPQQMTIQQDINYIAILSIITTAIIIAIITKLLISNLHNTTKRKKL